MRRFAAIALVLAGCSSRSSSPALGEAPVAWWESAPGVHPQLAAFAGWDADLDPVVGTVRSLAGPGMAIASPEAFVHANADLWGTDELVSDGTVADATVSSTVFLQRYQGLPVIGAHLVLASSHGKLVLVEGATYPDLALRDLETAPAVTETEAIAAASTLLPAGSAGDRDAARLVVLPERAPGTIAYHLAWEVSAWRGDMHAIVNVDARTGNVLGAYDDNRYEYPGKATAFVDERTVGDKMVEAPAAYLRLHSGRGATTTEADGTFAFSGEAGPLMVHAGLEGNYVFVENRGGDAGRFVGMMRPEKGYALEWTEAYATPEERDVFRGVNVTNRFVSTVYPDNVWMARPLQANVNLPRTCNAFWNGTSINFFREGNGCNNSGRIFDVIAHEWGHGLDQNLPGMALDGALGEFIGDEIGFVQTHSPLIGPGFLVDGRPVRDLEDPDYKCFDPKKRGPHAGGQLLGAVMWDVWNDLQRAGLTGEPLKRLMLRPIAIAQTRAEWYSAMLAVDDDDGNLANGTPHECLIYRQFDAHSCGENRWPGIPDRPPPQCER